MEQEKKEEKGKEAFFSREQWFLIGLGVVTFGLLMFTDRTALQNEKSMTAPKAEPKGERTSAAPNKSAEPETAPQKPTLAALDPMDGEAAKTTTQIEKQFQDAKTRADSARVYDRLSAASAAAGRPDFAALYQEKYYAVAGGEEMLLKTARLFSEAAQAPFVRQKEPLAGGFQNEAVKYYEEFLTRRPAETDAQVELGVLYVHSPEPMKGIRKLLDVVEKKPNHFKANLELAKFSIQTSQFDKAESRLNAALQSEPTNWEAHFFKGVLYERKGKPAEARAAYQAAMKHTRDPAVLDLVQAQIKNLPQ